MSTLRHDGFDSPTVQRQAPKDRDEQKSFIVARHTSIYKAGNLYKHAASRLAVDGALAYIAPVSSAVQCQQTLMTNAKWAWGHTWSPHLPLFYLFVLVFFPGMLGFHQLYLT